MARHASEGTCVTVRGRGGGRYDAGALKSRAEGLREGFELWLVRCTKGLGRRRGVAGSAVFVMQKVGRPGLMKDGGDDGGKWEDTSQGGTDDGPSWP